MANWMLLVLRWTGRISGLLLVGLVLAFAVGLGPPNPFKAPLPVQVEFLGVLLVVVGCLAGLRWEGLGGVMVISGFATFLLTELIVNGSPPGGAIPFFLVPGVLYLLSYFLRLGRQRMAGGN